MTLLSEDLVVVVLDDLELQHSEQFLVGAGKGKRSSMSAAATSRP